MIRYIYADALHEFPKLAATMFADRAAQFAGRLKWDVTVHADGGERDQYDPLNPLYVIWERPDGTHGGSMRFLPSTGRTMLSEHFAHIEGDYRPDPGTWECTRFCLAPGEGGQVTAVLLAAAADMGLRLGLGQSVGVFDACMLRVYRRSGWVPRVLGRADGICAGEWTFTPEIRDALLERAGVTATVAEHWFRRSFGAVEVALAA